MYLDTKDDSLITSLEYSGWLCYLNIKKPIESIICNWKRLCRWKRSTILETWNIRGLNTKKKEILDETTRSNANLAVLTETIESIRKKRKEKRAKAGVSILIKIQLARYMRSWKQVDEKLLYVTIIGVYALLDDEKDKYKLNILVEKVSNRRQLLVMRNFNSTVDMWVHSKVQLTGTHLSLHAFPAFTIRPISFNLLL